jgi:hypothetical protein
LRPVHRVHEPRVQSSQPRKPHLWGGSHEGTKPRVKVSKEASGRGSTPEARSTKWTLAAIHLLTRTTPRGGSAYTERGPAAAHVLNPIKVAAWALNEAGARTELLLLCWVLSHILHTSMNFTLGGSHALASSPRTSLGT